MIYLAIKIRDSIFWEIEDYDLVFLICRKLLEWQRFDEIMEFLYCSSEIANFVDLNLDLLSTELI